MTLGAPVNCRVLPRMRSFRSFREVAPTNYISITDDIYVPSSSVSHPRAPFADPLGMISHPPAHSTTADAFLGLPLVPYASTPVLGLVLACAPPYLAPRSSVLMVILIHMIPTYTRKAARCIQQFSAVEHDPAPIPPPPLTRSTTHTPRAASMSEPSACVSGQS
ncbi:hypothetical protein B0H14DRAFT_3455983 [Mycena olivaceomarginata]|nr:hypothetical protein B0H14DRAFT_3455983 [Mycena olivaceomarginata]